MDASYFAFRRVLQKPGGWITVMWTIPHLVVNRIIAKNSFSNPMTNYSKTGHQPKLPMPVVLRLCYTLKFTQGACKNLMHRLHPTPIRISGSGAQASTFLNFPDDSNESSDPWDWKNALKGRRTSCSNFVSHISFKIFHIYRFLFSFFFSKIGLFLKMGSTCRIPERLQTQT